MIMCALGWIEKCIFFVAIFKNGYTARKLSNKKNKSLFKIAFSNSRLKRWIMTPRLKNRSNLFKNIYMEICLNKDYIFYKIKNLCSKKSF